MFIDNKPIEYVSSAYYQPHSARDFDPSSVKNKDFEFTSKLKELKDTLNGLKSNLKSSKVNNYIESGGLSQRKLTTQRSANPSDI